MAEVQVMVTVIQKQGRKNVVVAKGLSEPVLLNEDAVSVAAHNLASELVEKAWSNVGADQEEGD